MCDDGWVCGQAIALQGGEESSAVHKWYGIVLNKHSEFQVRAGVPAMQCPALTWRAGSAGHESDHTEQLRRPRPLAQGRAPSPCSLLFASLISTLLPCRSIAWRSPASPHA
eukprot:1210262-Rhodomonas_salina.1